MKLSIITVNLNNKDGLQRTAESVVCQTFKVYEWIVIDGGSTDGSRELIEQYADHISYWVSEPDKGIYNAMNKGIRRAKGEYCLFLNSGDYLIDQNVLSMVIQCDFDEDVVHGNVIFDFDDHQETRNTTESITLRTFVERTINHSGCALIRRDAFDRWGFYDERLKIVSDWKWFLKTLGLGIATARYIDVTMSVFDCSGISIAQDELLRSEREKVLNEEIPERILSDYRVLSSFEDELYAQELKIRSSLPYKIGFFIMTPARLVKKIIKK